MSDEEKGVKHILITSARVVGIFVVAIACFKMGVWTGIWHENQRLENITTAKCAAAAAPLDMFEPAPPLKKLPPPALVKPKKKPCKLWSEKQGMMVDCPESEATK